MNPPSALYGAMNKDRKPFTYTPGGLDLSEIKSERMAQRLMRNAMSQGVPETSVQRIQSPPPQLNSGALPNFNCLPVQVFPTFPLPANPKSLLRTRSNPDPPKEPASNTVPTPSLYHIDENPWTNINKPSSVILNNNNNINKPVLATDYKTVVNNIPTLHSTNYGSDGYTDNTLPEKCYDAEYFVLEPQGNVKLVENETSNKEDKISPYSRPILNTDVLVDTHIDRNPILLTSSSTQDRTTNDVEQKEVKIVKKQSKSENKADQNGDTEAAVVVKLPSKKSSAKTETKVEVLKKILPDGSVKEIKTTTTKTTIDGKTEIKTETETQIFPKEGVDIEEFEEEEEEETEDLVEENQSRQSEVDVVEETKIKESPENKSIASDDENEEDLKNDTEIKENGHIISGEENVEISTTKNVVVTQSIEQESEEEQEEEVEEQDYEGDEEKEVDVEVKQVIVLKKQEQVTEKPENEDSDEKIIKTDIIEDGTEDVEEEEEEEVIDDENVEDEQEHINVDIKTDSEKVEEVKENEVEKDEQYEEVEEQEEEDQSQKEVAENIIPEAKDKQGDEEEEEYEEAEDVQVKSSDLSEKPSEDLTEKNTEPLIKEDAEQLAQATESIEKATIQESSTEPSVVKEEIPKQELKSEYEYVHKITLQPESKVSFREPSIPLEKVEDIEIKPIGPAQEIIKKCHTEIITTTKDAPPGALSTQTEYNRIENIVTVNRTTKTLDHAYEQAEHTIPTVKTYFVPPNDRILSTPQPISRPYQPVYTPEPQTERRHSSLLDRLSTERQIPVQQPDIYQNNYQSYEQNQWLQEPQSEVLTVSNVKPSTITKNQQWYQQSKREENVSSNIVTPTPIMPSQQLTQSQLQPQPQTQPQYQSYVPPQYTPKPEFQPTYTDVNKQTSFKTDSTKFQQNSYPTYTPKPSWVSSTFETKPTPVSTSNQYSTLNKESKECYQKSTQQFTSSYVPPPWEQDSSYVANQNFYQPPPPQSVYTPSVNQSWKPKQPASKFSKPAPTAYIPPAPNQSFVRPVTNFEQSILPGRKTYYSEYERRYISVPESTYIPSETKFQAQPDPSPQYYFDNNEPSETVEPQWRKELREFTEKSSHSTTIQTDKSSVRPPWEDDPKYAAPDYISTVTPTWTQTLRPRSWRERSFEPEYIGSKEWPKTNTLGRGRPQSSYVKSNVETIRERSRGVSVDRYNPNSYQSPLSSEQPPVQSHTLNPNIHAKAYHNPNVPAYHARTSADQREQPAPYTPRTWGESRAPPVQSRSFKYLQWITGTED